MPPMSFGVAGGATGVPLMPPTAVALTNSTTVLTIFWPLIASVKTRFRFAMEPAGMPGGRGVV